MCFVCIFTTLLLYSQEIVTSLCDQKFQMFLHEYFMTPLMKNVGRAFNFDAPAHYIE